MYLFNISVNLRFSWDNYSILPALPAINCVYFIIVWSQSTVHNFIYFFLLNKQKLQMGVTLQISENLFFFFFVKQARP